MGDNSQIEWTDATWQPITGCSIVSPGCINCYAMRLAGGRLRNHPSRKGLTMPSKNGPVWTGELRFNKDWLEQPLHWARCRRVFVCAHGDLFHEDCLTSWLDAVFAVMALGWQHEFQVLTKRPQVMRDYISDPMTAYRVWTYLRKNLIHAHVDQYCDWMGRNLPLAEYYQRLIVKPDIIQEPPVTLARSILNWPLPNVWCGVSAERQQEAEERIPFLLQTPAAVRFVSAEPLLGPIDLNAATVPGRLELTGQFKPPPSIDWVIVGGESGPHARIMRPEWARLLRDQCKDGNVSFFFKQWGEWISQEELELADPTPDDAVRVMSCEGHSFAEYGPHMWRVGKKNAGRLLDGIEHNAMPVLATQEVTHG